MLHGQPQDVELPSGILVFTGPHASEQETIQDEETSRNFQLFMTELRVLRSSLPDSVRMQSQKHVGKLITVLPLTFSLGFTNRGSSWRCPSSAARGHTVSPVDGVDTSFGALPDEHNT